MQAVMSLKYGSKSDREAVISGKWCIKLLVEVIKLKRKGKLCLLKSHAAPVLTSNIVAATRVALTIMSFDMPFIH